MLVVYRPRAMKATRVILIVCEIFLTVATIVSGISMLAGFLEQGDALEDTWFSDFTIPALILIFVHGGLAVAGTVVLLKRVTWAPFVTFSSGMAMVIWICVQMTMVQYSWMQPAFLGLGVVIAALSQVLYWGERRRRLAPA
jgi:hypothetical protein